MLAFLTTVSESSSDAAGPQTLWGSSFLLLPNRAESVAPSQVYTESVWLSCEENLGLLTELKWNESVSLYIVVYISRLQNVKEGQENSKVFFFLLVEHARSLTFTPRFSRATTPCLVFPVCVHSYHWGIFPRWNLRTRLFFQYLWLQPIRAVRALHISSASVEHMYSSCDKCKMHLLTVDLQVVYTTHTYISVQEIPDRNKWAQHITEFLHFLSL